MASPEFDLADVTTENLAHYLIDIRLPEPVGWWPLAPGWWLLAAATLLVVAWWLFRQARLTLDGVKPKPADQIFAQLQSEGNTSVYCHQMGRLLRKAALTGEDRQSVASLHGESWVRWMEASTGRVFSIDAQNLLGKQCYSAAPPQVSQSVHQELVAWLDHRNSQAGKDKYRA